MLHLNFADKQGQSFITDYIFGTNSLLLKVAYGRLLENGLREGLTRIEHGIIMNHSTYCCQRFLRLWQKMFSQEQKTYLQLAKNTGLRMVLKYCFMTSFRIFDLV